MFILPYRVFSCDVTHTKSPYSCHFGVQHRICSKASVLLYKAREALYAEFVVRADKWTTGEYAQHVNLWQDRNAVEPFGSQLQWTTRMCSVVQK